MRTLMTEGQIYFVLAQLWAEVNKHKKQLDYVVWRQVIIQKEEIHTCAFIDTRDKNLKKNEKYLILSHI